MFGVWVCEEKAVNLWNKAKTMVDGAANLAIWVGSGGVVVSPEEAQDRAAICLNCPQNKPGMEVTKEVALATRKFLEFKNQLQLRVNGEKSLFHCATCSCVLRLLIWEPQDRIKSQMTEEEIKKSPAFCWKLKP